MEYDKFYKTVNVENPFLERSDYKNLSENLRDHFIRDFYEILNREDLTEEEVKKCLEAIHLAQLSGTSLEKTEFNKIMSFLEEAVKALSFFAIGISIVAFYSLAKLPNSIYEAGKDFDGNSIKELILEDRIGKKTPFYGVEENGRVRYITADEVRKRYITDHQTREFYQKVEDELNEEE